MSSYTFTINKINFALSLTTDCGFPNQFHKPAMKAIESTICALPKSTLKELIPHTGEFSINLYITSPLNIQKLNKQYRNKNKPTDVLSFSRIEAMPSGLTEWDLGDLIVCWDIAKSQAQQLKVPTQEELERLVVHGTLHLFGYDHETNEKDAKKMFRLQESILGKM